MELAQEKQPILQANKDPGALQELTARENMLLAQATEAERCRMEAVNVLAEEWGISPVHLTVSELAKRAEDETGASLLEEGQALADVLQRLQKQNPVSYTHLRAAHRLRRVPDPAGGGS